MMSITSEAFGRGQPVPREYTADGSDISPPLRWEGAPQETASFALICDDPDAPRDEPWVHWIIWNIPADSAGLLQGLPRKPTLSDYRAQGANSWSSDNIGYRGPAPPKGHGVHHYHFKLYALDTRLDLEPGVASKKELLEAAKGHILAEAELIGTYER